MNIGTTIKILRGSQNISQKKLAKEINITPVYLSRLESNKENFNFKILTRIAYALGISFDLLLFLSSEIAEELPAKEAKIIETIRKNIMADLAKQRVLTNIEESNHWKSWEEWQIWYPTQKTQLQMKKAKLPIGIAGGKLIKKGKKL